MTNLSFEKLNKKIIAKIILAIISAYLIYRYRYLVASVIKPFLVAAIISYLLNPIVERFERKGIKRIIGVIIVYLSFIGIIIMLGFVLIPTLIREIGKLVENLPQYSSDIQKMLDNFQDGKLYNNLPQNIRDIIDQNILVLQSILLNALQKVVDSIISALSQAVNIVLTPVIIFYMLKDTHYFKNQLVLVIPKSRRQKAMLLFRDIDNAFGKFVRGQIIVATFVGVMTTALLLIIKVKYAVVLGLFAGMANIIPYFGPILGLIPTVAFAFFDSPTKALYAAGAFILVQQVESGILTPKIIGESVGIHPVYVILALLLGGKLLGIIGMILAVPVFVAIKLTMRHFLRRE